MNQKIHIALIFGKMERMRLFSILVLLFFSQLHAISDVNQLISEASAHNTYFLYEDAVKLLTEVIRNNPKKVEAYKERAFSYFELNCIDLALDDYQEAFDLSPPSKRHIKNYALSVYPAGFAGVSPAVDFAQGLLRGAMSGGREGGIQFVSSIRGGLTFLWSFACSPIDVSKELIEALRDIGEFLASGRVDLLLEEALPELVECRNYWSSWSEYTKGEKLGFIVGKYSILAFYYLATPDVGIHIYNNLKRANIMAILGRYSVTRSARILEASAKHTQRSKFILKRAAAGSIIPHNPNVLPHIFTKKHRWDKFIKITGNHEKDFETLVLFLEKEGILQCKRELDWAHKSVTTYKYTKKIGKHKIVALFEINKNKLPLLRNAWVEVGIPYAP